MGLSGREVLLVLRARDEASRTLRRVSRSMSSMDRQAAMASAQSVATQQAGLRQLSNGMHDVAYNYRAATLEAEKLYNVQRESTQGVRRQLNERMRLGTIERDQYRAQIAAVRELEQNNTNAYRNAMLQARTLRNERSRTIDMQKREMSDSIRAHQETLSRLNEEHQAIRARGYALMENGAAVATVGAGMTLMGALGLKALTSLTTASINYNQEASKTLTQVDQTGVSLDRIKKIGIDVARTVPVPFEQIQAGLYDIFSSIDVSVAGAHKLLKQFAKDAVGGQTDLLIATKANLAIMNAYGIKTKDVGRVSDFMFRIVQKGVGSYQEFATTIGNAIPSAVRLGVSLEDLGGVLTFLTRNGLSAARASTSAARAFDALSNPKTADNLRKMGVEIVNAKGDLKPLPKILDLMNDKMSKIQGSSKKSEFLKNAFQGSGGTIQALRFFNLAFKNMDQFKKRLKEMGDSSGVAKDKFTEMSKTPQAEIERMKNEFKTLKVELGDELLPVLIPIVRAIKDILSAFNNLSPGMKKALVIFALIAAAVTTVMGVILILVGGITMLAGAAVVMGVPLLALVGIFAGVAAVIAAVGIAAYALYANWQDVAPLFDEVKEAVIGVYNYLKDVFGPFFKDVWAGLKMGFTNFVDEVKQGWSEFQAAVQMDQLKKRFGELRTSIDELKPYIDKIGKWLKEVLPVALAYLGRYVRMMAVLWGVAFGNMLDILVGFSKAAVGSITSIVEAIGHTGSALKKAATGDFKGAITESAKAIQSVKGVVTKPFEELVGTLKSVGKRSMDGLVKQMEISSQPLSRKGQEAGKKMKKGLETGSGNWADLATQQINGLIAGIDANEGRAVGRARTLAQRMNDAFKATQLIQSPSKVWAYYGKMIVEGLVKGIKDDMPSVGKVMDLLDRASAGRKIKPKRMKRIRAEVKKTTKKPLKELQGVYARLQTVTAELDKQRDVLKDLQSAYDSYVSSVESGIKSFGSLASVGSTTDVFGNEIPVSATNIASGLTERLNKIQDFGNKLNALRGMGYTKEVIDQIIQMGPEQGWEYAAALLTATPTERDTINRATSSIAAYAHTIATDGANMMYQAGINTALGLIRGLEAQEAALMATATRIANKIAKAIKKALKIKSPSRVALDIGGNFGGALASGLDRQGRNVEMAARQLARATYDSFGDPSANFAAKYGAYSPVGGWNSSEADAGYGTQPPQVIFEEGAIQTQEIDPATHSAQLGYRLATKIRQ